MSLVAQTHWVFWMGNMPMPEDCTFEQMWAMYDVVKQIEDKEYAVQQIAWYESLWRQYLPRYQLAEQQKDMDQKQYEIYTDIMKLIKQGILFWREELA